MPQLKRRSPHLKPLKYEMAKRKETWKAFNDPIEGQLKLPPHRQSAVVKELVIPTCYNDLALMLNLVPIDFSDVQSISSVETIIPYHFPKEASFLSETKKSLGEDLKGSVHSSRSTVSTASTGSSHSDKFQSLRPQSPSFVTYDSRTDTEVSMKKQETELPTKDYSDLQSDYVEVENIHSTNQELVMKHKAILKFLGLPEAEAATWRVKEAKDVSDLSEMTLEEQGDFLINKIAVDFCKWLGELGGSEKSFITEGILKELFQVGMDNPASRAICIKRREKRVLYYKLAEFLQVPKKSFHEILSLHLNWDAKVEKNKSKLKAFGKGLPKNLRFKKPKNKTAETWLEWNKLSTDQLSFADVYMNIKDLRSTKEYCKWLQLHPEYKRPQYLVDQGMFRHQLSVSEGGSRRETIASSRRSLPSTTVVGDTHAVAENLEELFGVKLDKKKFQQMVQDAHSGKKVSIFSCISTE